MPRTCYRVTKFMSLMTACSLLRSLWLKLFKTLIPISSLVWSENATSDGFLWISPWFCRMSIWKLNLYAKNGGSNASKWISRFSWIDWLCQITFNMWSRLKSVASKERTWPFLALSPLTVVLSFYWVCFLHHYSGIVLLNGLTIECTFKDLILDKINHNLYGLPLAFNIHSLIQIISYTLSILIVLSYWLIADISWRETARIQFQQFRHFVVH